MLTALEVFEKIEERSKSSIKKELIRDKMEIGQYVRQGDIYITRIPKITSNIEVESRQLAPGFTKGSRHIVIDSPKIKLFKGYFGPSHFKGLNFPEFAKGPQIKADVDLVITHPEHAHIKLLIGPACYQVTYQIDYERQQRVLD